MADVTRVLVGLEEFEVTGAVETAAGVFGGGGACGAPGCGVPALRDVQFSGQGVSHAAGARRSEL